MAKKKATQPKVASESAPDFESTLAEVEKIVTSLESGELGLTESLEQYESGIKRLKQCHQLLDAAEQKVSLLSGFDADGNPVTESIDQTSQRTGAGRVAKRTRPANQRKAGDRRGPSQDGPSVDGDDGLF